MRSNAHGAPRAYPVRVERGAWHAREAETPAYRKAPSTPALQACAQGERIKAEPAHPAAVRVERSARHAREVETPAYRRAPSTPALQACAQGERINAEAHSATVRVERSTRIPPEPFASSAARASHQSLSRRAQRAHLFGDLLTDKAPMLAGQAGLSRRSVVPAPIRRTPSVLPPRQVA